MLLSRTQLFGTILRNSVLFEFFLVLDKKQSWFFFYYLALLYIFLSLIIKTLLLKISNDLWWVLPVGVNSHCRLSQDLLREYWLRTFITLNFLCENEFEIKGSTLLGKVIARYKIIIRDRISLFLLSNVATQLKQTI